MPDANAEPKQHPSPANVDVAGGRPRGGAGLFSLYRSLGSPAAAEPAPAPNKGSATVVSDPGTSRAARLLAAKTTAATAAPSAPTATGLEKKPEANAVGKAEGKAETNAEAKPEPKFEATFDAKAEAKAQPKTEPAALSEGARVRAEAVPETLPAGLKPVTPSADDSAAVGADELIDGPETKALGAGEAARFPNRDGEARRTSDALAKALEEVVTDLKAPGEPRPAPDSPRQARRARRGASARGLAQSAGYGNVDQRLIEARQKKQLKRRVRGEDYEQVTVIMDRELYLAFDACLRELSEKAGGHVKLSRSIFVRALLKRFLSDAPTKHKALDFGGLFTPDPRSAEELAVIEAALMERLAE
ncbi:MAG: hypothetical protein KIS92_17085 [Planctomycetota bacterium]|nr:hypothetical protein [Planctomycetota bacterium]